MRICAVLLLWGGNFSATAKADSTEQFIGKISTRQISIVDDGNNIRARIGIGQGKAVGLLILD